MKVLTWHQNALILMKMTQGISFSCYTNNQPPILLIFSTKKKLRLLTWLFEFIGFPEMVQFSIRIQNFFTNNPSFHYSSVIYRHPFNKFSLKFLEEQNALYCITM